MNIINHQIISIANDELHLVEVTTYNSKLSRADRNYFKTYIIQRSKRSLDNYAVSHSYPYILMYFSQFRVSVDIECHTKFKHQYSTLIASENEIESLIKHVGELPSKVQLSSLWTLKEAYGKYYGVGLDYGLQSIVLNNNCMSSNFISPKASIRLYLGIDETYSFTIAHEKAWTEEKRQSFSKALNCGVNTFTGI
ncbi:MAG TPA: 4'-phosphopantetheinyl transferase superfamily protein [Candidatus Paenibacillus intestinavium]|nr:4'-phosphopantetheinyl transferase superfamily protein [Candidatus Paenibacillus intestinavium]